MKKSFAMLLAALMLLLTACGGDTASSGAASSGTPAAQKPVTGKPPEMFPLKGTIEEAVLVDQDGVKITATGLDYTSYDAQLALTIENNTSEDLSFHSGTLAYSCNSVNGYMFDGGYLAADIPAGKKSNETVSFSVSELTALGITDIADLEIGFDISDDSYDTYLQTGPLPLKTSLADTYDYKANTYRDSINGGALASLVSYTLNHFGEETLFDQCGVRVISQALITNSEGERALFLEVENTSAEQVSVILGDFHVNGLMIQSKNFTTNTVNPGKRRVITAQLSNMLEDACWEVFGVMELGDITFTLSLEDGDRNSLCPPAEVSMDIPGVQSGFDAGGEELYNENGIRIVYKGLVADSSSFMDDIHALFLVENSGSATASVSVAYDSVSVNGFMTDAWPPSRDILPGRSAVLDLSLQGDSLEENGIHDMDAIDEVEAGFTIQDSSYKTIAEPVVTFDGKSAG